MSLRDFFMRIFGGKSRFSLSDNSWAEAAEAYREAAVQRLAFNSAVNLIANTVSKCEFKTFTSGEEGKSDEYYLWNTRPNVNENAAVFWRKLIYRLCFDNECLVVFMDNYAYVADTFALQFEGAIKPNIYNAVSIGPLALNRSFIADEVLHFKLDNDAARLLLDSFYSSYQKLIEKSYKAFTRSRGEHGVLETVRQPGDINYEKSVMEMAQKIFKPYFENDNAVAPLFDGQKYTRTNSGGARELTDAGDSRRLIDDVFDMTARAFGIPPALLRGEMADTSVLMTNFLTFCIDPLCDMIAGEINAKRYRKERFLAGDYLKIDTSCVKHFDLLDAATAVDKLISSGTVSVNELREAIARPEIREDWAYRHYITKNYTLVENLEAAEGGDKNEQDDKN